MERVTKDKKDKKFKNEKLNKEKKMNRNQIADMEIEDLETKIKEETPPTGFYYLNNEDEEHTKSLYRTESGEEAKWIKTKVQFKELAMTKKTIKGLTDSRFLKMTPIQRSTLPHSLACRDILGASKTGSGKTLCFIIPVLEILYRNKWSSLDGLGALLILPTRELAIQVFEVFKLVGRYHDFSIGLVIGGNNVNHEKERLYKMNILIGTPGRLLQHFTETPYFSVDNLKVLVIDEVDRILDEGFEESLNEILTYLPAHRQSLLFSATLTKSIKRLAKINLKSTEYINLNNTDSIMGGEVEKITEKSEIGLLNKNNTENPTQFNPKSDNSITPINLNQYYTLVETHDKIDILFSFLKSHKNSKCLVFLNSCKQVRFYYEVFKRLKLGMTFLDLHGKQKQSKRTTIFYSFLQKKNTVLFATDIASRGVDFPHVDWVIQLDCPEDIQTYVHRVGRTARYKSKGNSILFVNPKEEKFVQNLNDKNIQIKKIKINQTKLVNLQPIVRSILSENPDLLYLAQKAISSYLKSIYLLSNKEVFDIKSIDLQKLSLSYGLVNMPELTILKKSQNDLKNVNRDEQIEQEELADEEYKNNDDKKDNKKKSKLQKLKDKIKMKKMQKINEVANKLNNMDEDAEEITDEDFEEEEDDFLTEKRNLDDEDEIENLIKKKNKKQKVEKVEEIVNDDTNKDDYYQQIKKRLDKTKENDKVNEKMRILEKHKSDRLRRKERDYEKHGLLEDDGEEDDVVVTLGDPNSNENDEVPELEEDIQEESVKQKKKKSKKIDINLKTSTLEEKEKVALELLNDTDDDLFV